MYSKIKITWNIYHLASEWIDAFVFMKRKYGKGKGNMEKEKEKCLEVGEAAGRVVPLTGFESHPYHSWVSAPREMTTVQKNQKSPKGLGRFLVVSS